MCCHIHLNVKGLYANYLGGDGVHFFKKSMNLLSKILKQYWVGISPLTVYH